MPLPPPNSFFDGGEPQSKVAPGDTGRELVHDVRNLISAVNMLTAVVKKQRQRQRQLIITGLVALLTLTIAIGYTRYLAVYQARQRIIAGYLACEQDNRRGAIEIEILSASLAANKDNPRARAFYTPRISALQHLQRDCEALFPRVHDKGYPGYLRL